MGTPEAILVIPEAADASTLETIAFHPNDKWLAVGGMDWLATGGSDGAVCIWDLEARDKLQSFPIGVTSLAFDPAGRYLAAGSMQQTVIVWDLSLEKKIFELAGHQDRIGAVLFSPDGSWLVSASDDSTVRVWNVLSGCWPSRGNSIQRSSPWSFPPMGNIYTPVMETLLAIGWK